MDKLSFFEILARYQAGNASEEEKAFLEAYYNAFGYRPDIMQELSATETEKLGSQLLSAITAKRQPSPQPVTIVKSTPFRQWLVAAAVIVVAVSVWLVMRNKTDALPATQQSAAILPASLKATLTLGNGTVVELDSTGKIVADVSGTQLKTSNNGLIAQTTTTGTATGQPLTLATPNGGQYRLTLPDGTRVWLNAASSVQFPSTFSGSDRTVSIKGEAYMEIAPNAAQPFYINTPATRIKVLGTSININAYSTEEAEKTTLLTGKIQVSNTASSTPVEKTLTPGFQLIAAASGFSIQPADTSQVMAWKNGLFYFNGNNLKAVLREIARWYNLDLVYEADPGNREINGKMQRNLTLAQTMNILKKINVNYKLDARKLIITK
jgi:transmembrane sensor